MSKRKWPVGSFVPCSPRHLHCSPAHAALVRSYREERERQETAFDEQTGGYSADKAFAKAKGAQLIIFKTWLKSHAKSNDQKIEEENAQQNTTDKPDFHEAIAMRYGRPHWTNVCSIARLPDTGTTRKAL